MREDVLFLYLMGAVTVVALWYVARFVVLWYFRIDRIVELLEKIAGEVEEDEAAPPLETAH